VLLLQKADNILQGLGCPTSGVEVEELASYYVYMTVSSLYRYVVSYPSCVHDS